MIIIIFSFSNSDLDSALSKKDIEIAIDKLFTAAKLLDSYEYPYLNRNKLSYKYYSYEEDNDDVEDYILLTSKNPSFSIITIDKNYAEDF